jgi:hypothetical protein
MKRSLIKLLLLVSFAYWASGLAMCLHERFEHAHDQEEAAAALNDVKPADPASKNSSEPPLQAPDDHDDCPTCQTLKLMKVEPLTPPPAIQIVHPYVETLPVIQLQARVLSFVLFLPARAPPAQFSLRSA